MNNIIEKLGLNLSKSYHIKSGDELLKFVSDNDYTPVLSEYETMLKNDHDLIVKGLEDIKQSALKLIGVNIIVDKPSMKSAVESIKNVKDKIEKSLMEFLMVLNDKQKSCDHDYRNTTHDSHYDYYICDKCGSCDRC